MEKTRFVIFDHQILITSVQVDVDDVMKFIVGISDISHSHEWGGCVMTLDLQKINSTSLSLSGYLDTTWPNLDTT